MCIDERNINNQFVCVECNKIIVRFELSNHLNDATAENALDDEKKSDWSSRFEQLEKKLKSTFNLGSQEKQVDVRAVPDLGSFVESDDLYFCSQDNADFEKIIAQSTIFSASDHLASNNSRAFASSLFRAKRGFGADDNTNDAYSQFGISSALVKKSFDIHNLMLPYEASFASESIVESVYADSLTNVFLLMSVIILMLILFIVFNLVYSRLRKQMSKHSKV